MYKLKYGLLKFCIHYTKCKSSGILSYQRLLYQSSFSDVLLAVKENFAGLKNNLGYAQNKLPTGKQSKHFQLKKKMYPGILIHWLTRNFLMSL